MSMSETVDKRLSELPHSVPRRHHSGKAKTARQKLKNFQDLPDFLRDNEFIISGYRHRWSMKETVVSLFQLHNETFNVWTHLLGFLSFVWLTIYLAMTPFPSLAHPRDSLEILWTSVQHKMHYIGDHLSDSSNAYKDAFYAEINTLQDSLVAIQHQVHDNLELSKESFYSNAFPLFQRLQKSYGGLIESMHHLPENTGHLADWVSQLKCLTIKNLEKSFSTVQESLHFLQNDLAAGRSTFSESLRGLQQNLIGLSSLLVEVPAEHDIFSNTTALAGQNTFPECPLVATDYTSRVPRWPLFVYMAGSMFCLLASAACHLFSCCIQHVYSYQQIWRFDYTGIAVLIVTSFYPVVYYAFLCRPFWIKAYLSGITLSGALTIGASLCSFMQARKFRPLRAALFSGLGLLGGVPIAHALIADFDDSTIRYAVLMECLVGILYLGGAGFFVSRVPERFKPGAFDILFSSHQIFHIFVVLAALVHYKVSSDLMHWRDAINGCSR